VKFWKEVPGLNFKKTYKEANDSIHADKTLINTIFEKAEKKPSFFLMYSKQLTACAAALILVCLIGIVPYINSSAPGDKKYNTPVAVKNDNYYKNDKKSSKTYTADNKNSEKQVVTGEKDSREKDPNEYSNENNIVSSDNESEEPSDSNDSTNDETSTESTENIAGVAVAKAEESDESHAVSSDSIPSDNGRKNDRTQINKEDNSFDENSGVTSKSSNAGSGKKSGSSGGGAFSAGAGGGGGGSASSMNYYPISMKEYCEHLEFDIVKFFNGLPAGMTFYCPESVSVVKDVNGKIIRDFALFNAFNENNPEQIITLSVSSKIDDVSLSGGNVVYINGVKATLNNGDNSSAVFFKYRNAYVNISSHGIENSDFMNYVSNVVK